MIFLKSLIFIVWNIALGFAVLGAVHWLLFNKKALFVFGKKIPLTPGFIVSKRDWLFNKARDILHDYLEQSEATKNGYLAKWEKIIFDAVWEKTAFIDGWRYVPKNIKDRLHTGIATAIRDVARNILRKMIPRLIEQYRLEMHIDKYDLQFSIDFFYRYFRKYIYKPLWYTFLGLNTLIGIMNMILYLIIA